MTLRLGIPAVLAIRQLRQSALRLIGIGVVLSQPVAVLGENDTYLAIHYPALRQLLLAHDVVQARAYEDKQSAVSRIVLDYLAVAEYSIANRTKSDELLSDHEFAYAYKAGFPQLSGLTWASQWLKLALLEVVVSAPDAESREADIQNLRHL